MADIKNKDGIFINSNYFREAALYFQQHKRFTDAIPNTYDWKDFWDREEDRILNGYTVGGASITGDHYYYLNYCPIKRTLNNTDDTPEKVVKSRRAKKVMEFPDFWDGDYEYFWVRQIASDGIEEKAYKNLLLDSKIKTLDGGKHMIVGKARRKGFSYKNGSIASKEYNFVRDSLTVLGAFDKKFLYPKGTMTMAVGYSDFINEYTDFGKRRLIDKQEHIKAGYIKIHEGMEITAGFKSEIIALTFKDNPDAIRGKDASLVVMEEVGAWPGMKSAFKVIQPTVSDGINITGQIIAFGTGGDMEGGTIDFCDIFYDPASYDCVSFENIWDDNAGERPCGYFFPAYKNLVGFIDSNGNSDKVAAKNWLDEERVRLSKSSKDKKNLIKHITEWANSPGEAFSISSVNIFDTEAIQKQLGFVRTCKDGDILGTPGTLDWDEKQKLVFSPNHHLVRADFPTKGDDEEGCIVIWEHPEPNPPYGLYIAGNDPYDQDQASNSSSLGSVIVKKRATVGYDNHDKIVCEYTGRPRSAKEFYENVRKILLYYNANCLYENEKNGIKTYFEQKNCLYLLAHTPTILKSNINSTVSRVYGQHMTTQVKEELEIYLRDWLDEEVGDGKKNINFIYSEPILKELLFYNKTGNFDRIIALLLLTAQGYQMHKIIAKAKSKKVVDDFFTRKLFTN